MGDRVARAAGNGSLGVEKWNDLHYSRTPSIDLYRQPKFRVALALPQAVNLLGAYQCQGLGHHFEAMVSCAPSFVCIYQISAFGTSIRVVCKGKYSSKILKH